MVTRPSSERQSLTTVEIPVYVSERTNFEYYKSSKKNF